ncbi:MAG: MmgE/PrpD family protein, partial [Deltaproteobacteria bacterium]
PMSRAMDLGDIHDEAGHCSEYTLPTLLAATGLKDRVTGKDFITAFVLGQEVLLRIGMAYKFLSRAFPMGRLNGDYVFGCVAAVGRLLGLSLEELQNAEGIISEMTQPHSAAMLQPITLIVRIHHGFVCQDSINACLLAKRGITGPREAVLSAPMGYLGFAKWETDPDALIKGLGERWETVTVMRKHYPCVVTSQAAVDGILGHMKQHNFKAEDIASIDITRRVHKAGGIANIDVTDTTSRARSAAIREAKYNPQTVPECQFSLPYAVAAAACNGDLFVDSYTPHAMARKDIRDLMTRVSEREDPNLPRRAATVTTVLKNGKKYSSECIYPKGHPKNPFTEEELVAKLKKCVPYSAYELNDAVVDSLVNSLLGLEKVDDVVSAVLKPLTPN